MQRARSWLAALAALCLAAPVPALSYTILGTGTGSLLGNDATDRGDDGDEACTNEAGKTPLTCGFEATFTTNYAPGFDVGESAFNVFDNEVGGGDSKWCCNTTGADDTSRSNRGSPLSGAKVGSIRSHAGERWYGIRSSNGSSWSSACAFCPTSM